MRQDAGAGRSWSVPAVRCGPGEPAGPGGLGWQRGGDRDSPVPPGFTACGLLTAVAGFLVCRNGGWWCSCFSTEAARGSTLCMQPGPVGGWLCRGRRRRAGSGAGCPRRLLSRPLSSPPRLRVRDDCGSLAALFCSRRPAQAVVFGDPLGYAESREQGWGRVRWAGVESSNEGPARLQDPAAPWHHLQE